MPDTNNQVEKAAEKHVILLLDDWQECHQHEKECEFSPPDPKYDMNQLKIFDAVAMSLTYSEVGLLRTTSAPTEASRPLKNIPVADKTMINPKAKIALIQELTGTKSMESIKGFKTVTVPTSQIKRESGSRRSSRKSLPPEMSSPIIIFHDLFRSQSEWQAFAASLASLVRRRCIVVDLRNHGTSPWNSSCCGLREIMIDMRHFFRELRLVPSNCTIIAHGLSGWCVMIYCLLHPYKVRNLIIVEANPNNNPHFSHDVSKLRQALHRISTPPLGKALTSLRVRIGDFLEKFVPNVNVRSFVVQNTVVSEVIGRPDKWNRRRKEISDSLESYTKFPDFLQIYNFDKPTLFVASNVSRTVRKDDEPKIRKLFPQAVFVYYNKDSKSPHVDYYDYFLDIVKNFLKEEKKN